MNILETLTQQVTQRVTAGLQDLITQALRDTLTGNGTGPMRSMTPAPPPAREPARGRRGRRGATKKKRMSGDSREERYAQIMQVATTPMTPVEIANKLGKHAPGVASTLRGMVASKMMKKQGMKFVAIKKAA